MISKGHKNKIKSGQESISGVSGEQLEQIEKIFAHGEYADIREGECTLTDIWFEYNALKMAKERGIEAPDNNILADLIDEAYDTCPPPKEIDFRMSFDRKNKYRISN